ncbi:hypothetical protein GTR02_10270 [Kineococcus sp. R8]|nr:hypothetical protein [Kineococcus siccus]NAZ82203.1 hypothetical protein [Kineococcus siccus]
MITATLLVRRYFVDLARTCGALCRPVLLSGTSRPGLPSMPGPARLLA